MILDEGWKKTETKEQGRRRRFRLDKASLASFVRHVRLEEARRTEDARRRVEQLLGSYEDRPL